MVKAAINQLVTRLHAGDDAGLELLFQQFAARLITFARGHISTHYRNRVDPEDVVQSVFKSFLDRYRDRKLDIRSGDGLWGLLTVITLRKCADRIVQLRTQCRDVRREVSDAGLADPEGRLYFAAIDRQPTPEEACMLAESVTQLLCGFDPEDRPIVELHLQGYSAAETATLLNRAERSVRRIRERVRQQLLKGLSDQDPKL
ncbi:MAG: hypothetical protein KDA89_08780 [Planctomycetaceae bacterium]|nr:hypothetical protein [Planctomycetaceae bacterium]